MATKEQIFEWIRYTCVTDTDAEQVAEIVATKLAEEQTRICLCAGCDMEFVCFRDKPICFQTTK